jgi:hypothetical protein
MRRIQVLITFVVSIALGTMLLFSFQIGDSYAYWTESFSIVLLLIPLMLEYLAFFALPWPVLLSASAALILHSSGLAIGLYAISWWDGITHFVSGIVVALLVMIVILVVLDNYPHISVPAKWVPFLILVAVIAFEGFWEIMEFGVDQIMGTTMQNGISDTVSDIITSSVAGIVSGIVTAVFTRKSSIKQLVVNMQTERLIRVLQKHASK